MHDRLTEWIGRVCLATAQPGVSKPGRSTQPTHLHSARCELYCEVPITRHKIAPE